MFRSIDSRPPPSPNLHRHHHHHHHQQQSHHDPANYRYSSSPYPSPPPLFSSKPYLPRPILPPPPQQAQPPKPNPNHYQFSVPDTHVILPPPQQVQPPKPNPNYYQFSFPDTHEILPPPQQQVQPPKPNPSYYQLSFPDTPDHRPRCSVASNFQYFPAVAPNHEETSSSSNFSRLDFDQDLRRLPDRVERGSTFVSTVRPEDELLRVGMACYGGYDSSCSSRLYGGEINRRLCELDGLTDSLDFRLGSLDYGEQEFAGRFSKERCDDSYRRRSIGGLDKSFHVIPTKQVQKRTVFSRLQMPKIHHSPRKFDRERCYGSVYDDKNGSSQFRCKGVLPCPEIVVKDRRNGKSVDLDVSFKSNSLVAKAVVAPSSSVFLLDDVSSPKAKRPRSLWQFDKESDCLPLRNKFAEGLPRPNGSQSMATVPTGSRLVPNKGSPSKINRPKNAMASIKDSGKLPLKKEIEQGMKRLNEFSNPVASTGLVQEDTQVGKGMISAGSGGMINENAVKSGQKNCTDEAWKSLKILNADNAHHVLQLKAGAFSIGKSAAASPKESVAVVRDKFSICESDKKDGLLTKEDVLVIKSEVGNEKGEGGKFKMVLKANKACRPLKKDNVLVKKNEAVNEKAEGGKVEMVLTADKADHSLQSLVKAAQVSKGIHVGPTRNVPVLVDRVVTSESGEKEGRLNKTDFSVSDCRVVSGKCEAGEPKNVSKAEKSTYNVGVKSNLVVGWRISIPKSGEKPGYSNECDVSASNIHVGKGKSESGGIEKVYTGPDRLSTTEAVPMRKVIDGGPKENVCSCKDDILLVLENGTSSGRKYVAGSDQGKNICGDKNSIPSGAPARKVVQEKKIVKKVVKVKGHPEIHHLSSQKDEKSWKPDDTAVTGLAAMIGHGSSAAESSLEVENACSDVSASPEASNIALNDLCTLTQTLEKGISPAINGDVNGEDDNRMNNSQKQFKISLQISQVGPSCIKETSNSASKNVEIPQDSLISNSSQNVLDFTIVSNLKASTQNCIPLTTNGGPGEHIISKNESLCISRSDPANLVFHRISMSASPDPDTSLINAQEPNLPRGPDKESIDYPSMPSTLSASPEDTPDALQGSSDPRYMKPSSDLKENSKVPAKYSIFEYERQSSSKSLPIELNGSGSTRNSNVLIPDKKSRKYSVISQCTRNITSSGKGSLSTNVAQPGVNMLNPSDSFVKNVDNSPELTSAYSVWPMLTADHVGGFDISLTSSKHLNNIQESETMGGFANGLVPVDTVMDVHESGVSPGTKKRKLSCSKEHSRGTSIHEHMSLPNDDRIFFSGKKLATGEDSGISGIKGGPLSRVALNVMELSSEKRGNTSFFDVAVLPGTDKSINNKSQTQKLLNYVSLPECSPVQNELSDLYRMGDTKEGCLASSATNFHNMEVVKKIGESKIKDAPASEKQDMGWCEMAQSNCPREVHVHTMEKIPGSLLGNQPRDSPFSTNIPCAAGIENLPNSGSSNEMMDPKSCPIPDRSSPEETGICLGSKVSIFKSPLYQFPQKMMGNDSNEQADKPDVPEESMNVDDHPVVHDNSPLYSNSVQEIQKDCSILEKPLVLPREDFRNTELCYKGAGLPVEPKPCIPEQRALPVHSSVISRTSKINNSTTNSHTWHRTSNVSAFIHGMQPSPKVVLPMKRSFTGGNGEILNSSYVRKGNSLVRKPTAPASHFASSAVQKSDSLVVVEPEKKNVCGKTVNSSDHTKILISEGMVSSSERPLSPSVPSTSASPNHIIVSSEKFCTSSSAGPLVNISDIPTANSVNPGQGSHLGYSCEDTMGPELRQDQLYSAGQKNMHNGSSNRILYVKPKSNKLIATKDLSDQDNITEKNKALTSGGYFKRKRNQLIRSSVGNGIAHEISMCLVDAASKDHGTSEGLLSSWKRHQMVIPQLFPWKRASYWRKLMKISMDPSGRSCPASSQRLKLSRKRDAVYIRSNHGLSLRRSKVLSIGGSSLKWSKSIERRSKKVNEDATRAVLEAQREKREQETSTSARTKKENNGSRGRIFRIGSQRYKMDPSKRTLQRIPDDESSTSAASETKKFLTKFFVPRRLLIGNDEYVRLGNGNQLIRDPKKRSRLLASEKVRWSLHTARQRLAKKKKYCQFFTRFGKCNKDGGKCPYIHDPSKIAVCTKFLNGLCSNKDCKLTHKIIPERMPDCSFFLQGLCANKNCPYRHVNVNPKAPTCEAFLKGYCMDGNECRKKHSYVCPVFGATGNCPQGSKCKLHHPKARNRVKKRKRSREKKNGQDRYFGSMSRRVLGPGAFVSEKPSSDTHGETLDLPDYIALGSSDDEAGEGLIKPFGLRELDIITS